MAKAKAVVVVKEEEKQLDQIQDGYVIMDAAQILVIDEPVNVAIPKPIKKRAVKAPQVALPPPVPAAQVPPKVKEARKPKAKAVDPIAPPLIKAGGGKKSRAKAVAKRLNKEVALLEEGVPEIQRIEQ